MAPQTAAATVTTLDPKRGFRAPAAARLADISQHLLDRGVVGDDVAGVPHLRPQLECVLDRSFCVVAVVGDGEQQLVGDVDDEPHHAAPPILGAVVALGRLIGLQVAAVPMESFGVNVDDSVAERIEDKRVRITDEGEREIVSRSQVVNELLRVGLAADEIIEDAPLDLPRGRGREAFIRQAVIDALDEEGVDVAEL